MFPRVRRVLVALLLCLLLFTTGCATKAPGRFDQVQQESSKQKSGQAVAKEATQGSEFNKFFHPQVRVTNESSPKRKKASLRLS